MVLLWWNWGWRVGKDGYAPERMLERWTHELMIGVVDDRREVFGQLKCAMVPVVRKGTCDSLQRLLSVRSDAF